eukprot:Platyproteum_vivax@DN7563_c1_g1_i2.p1
MESDDPKTLTKIATSNLKPMDRFRQGRMDRATWPVRFFKATPTAICLGFVCLCMTALGICLILVAPKAYITDVAWYKTGDKEVFLNVAQDLVPPIYLYYRLSDFTSNHKRFGESKSRLYYGSSYNCRGIEKYGKAKQIRPDLASTMLNYPDDADMEPCGLAAISMFTDTFQLKRGSQNIILQTNSVAWPDEHKFYAKDGTTCQDVKVSGRCSTAAGISATVRNKDDLRFCKYWICPAQNYHYQGWVRFNPRKQIIQQWGKINQKLPKGTYTVDLIANTWPADKWMTKKGVQIGVTTGAGGNSPFLGWVCVATAILLFLQTASLLVPQLLRFQAPTGLVKNLLEDEDMAGPVSSTTAATAVVSQQPVATTLISVDLDSLKQISSGPLLTVPEEEPEAEPINQKAHGPSYAEAAHASEAWKVQSAEMKTIKGIDDLFPC